MFQKNEDLRGHLQVVEMSKEEMDEYVKCSRDIFYFSKYFYILTDEGEAPIHLREYQERIIRCIVGKYYDKEGVMNRISDKLFSGLKEIKSYAGTSTETSDGSSLGTLILNLQTKMSNFKTMMDSYESALYKKYDAMETAIQQLSVSLGYITSGNS